MAYAVKQFLVRSSRIAAVVENSMVLKGLISGVSRAVFK